MGGVENKPGVFCSFGNMNWEVKPVGVNVVHVLPIGDEQEHDEEFVWAAEPIYNQPISKCTCGAVIELSEKGCWIIIHQAFDGRQALEWALDILGENDVP
jgi:hypothetical protein